MADATNTRDNTVPHRSRLRLALLAGAALAAANAGAQAASLRFAAGDVVSAVAPAQTLSFEVFLTLRNTDALHTLLAAQQDRGSQHYHQWLTPAEFSARFGPTDATVAAVTADLQARGMAVQRRSRSLRVTGHADAIGRAFGTTLQTVRAGDATRIVALDDLRLTPAMQAAGAQVFAFSPHRLDAHIMSQVVRRNIPFSRESTTGPYFYNDLKQAYGYPAANAAKASGSSVRLDGTGATIGVLMASDVLDADIAKMFNDQGYHTTTGKPVPTLYGRFKVDGGNTANPNNGAFGEASLDVQMELGGAPGAHVVLYATPDLSNASVIDGYTDIVDDNLLAVVSSSFGLCEKTYTAAYNNGTDETAMLTAEDELFQQGNSQGITFLASSGDSSGKECPSVSYYNGGTGTFQVGPSAPATSPNVTAVGGTNLITTFSKTSTVSKYVSENAYSDPEKPYDPSGLGHNVSGGYWGAGGGVSVVFARPAWQKGLNGASMRTTPDIGMQVGGCPSQAITPCNGGDLAVNGNGNTQRSEVAVVENGSYSGVIGTSVSSPEFASVMALIVEQYGRQGNISAALYSFVGTSALHVGIPGYNAVQPNTKPNGKYNNTVGIGTPFTAALVGAPTGTALAGNPGTASNP